MAEMYGVKITGHKTFMGMEGPTAQGNVRNNGKLLGFWSQDPNGGICDYYEFDKEDLREAAQKLYDSKPKEWQFRNLYTDENGNMTDDFIDILMYELSSLTIDEKEWQKMSKRGYPVMVHYHTAPDPKYPKAVPLTKKIFLNTYFIASSDSEIREYIEEDGEPIVIEKIYKVPEDFIIIKARIPPL